MFHRKTYSGLKKVSFLSFNMLITCTNIAKKDFYLESVPRTFYITYTTNRKKSARVFDFHHTIFEVFVK